MKNQELPPQLIRSDYIQGVVGGQNGIDTYQFPRLKVDIDLVILAKAGDFEALDLLEYPRLPIVASIAESFRDMGVEYLDLIQVGSMGLRNAIFDYDINSGQDFSRYAVSKIRKSMESVVGYENITTNIVSPRSKNDIVETVISTLPDRQQEIVRMNFGFDRFRGYTITEVSREFNLPVEDVQILQEEVVKRMRNVVFI